MKKYADCENGFTSLVGRNFTVRGGYRFGARESIALKRYEMKGVAIRDAKAIGYTESDVIIYSNCYGSGWFIHDSSRGAITVEKFKQLLSSVPLDEDIYAEDAACGCARSVGVVMSGAVRTM